MLKPSISEVEGSGTLSTKIFWSFVAIPKMKVFFSFWNTVCACFRWERPIMKLQIYYQPVDPDEKFAMISAASTDCDSLKNCWSNYTNKTLLQRANHFCRDQTILFEKSCAKLEFRFVNLILNGSNFFV